jgi:AraC family transcriptional regulator
LRNRAETASDPAPERSAPAEAPRVDYVERVNRAIDHVLAHLDEPLPLERVARAASFSPFHFHRVFKALVGETLNQFVKRLRLERALRMMSFEPERSLTEVALACGFQSSSDFSRSFKQAHGVPPSDFDLDALRARRRGEWQATIPDEGQRHRLDPLPPGLNPDGFEVTLERLPAREVVYLRVHDPYRPDAVTGAAERLVAWAEQRGLAGGQWLGYMWDDPEIVPHERCRYDVGLVVPTPMSPGGEVGQLRFPPMEVARLEVRGGIELEVRALDWLYRTWLLRSDRVPSTQPCFVAWVGRPSAPGL